MCKVPHARVWSDYYRFPINMVFAAYLLKNAIFVLSRVGHLHPIIKPHRGAFVAFPKQNDKCPTKARRGMCTLGIGWAIFLCPAFVRSSRVKQIRRSNLDRAARVEKTRLISSIVWWLIHKQGEWLEIQTTLLSHSPTKCFVRPRVVTRNLCLPEPRSIHWI